MMNMAVHKMANQSLMCNRRQMLLDRDMLYHQCLIILCIAVFVLLTIVEKMLYLNEHTFSLQVILGKQYENMCHSSCTFGVKH